MKIKINQINKDFESRVRLGIMSMLMVNEWATFNEIKELLELSDGNLASHINTLESKNYIEVRKVFSEKKSKTSYRATAQGRNDFQKHIDALTNLIKSQ